MAEGLKVENADTANICFRSDDWLRTFSGGMLIREMVLDYFSLSPFYDRNCNNELAKMQNLDPSRVSSMPGGPDRFEYVLHQKAIPPHLFTICKQQRLGPDSTKLLAMYYVLDGTIYPGPSLHSVLSSRTVRCLHSVRMALQTLAGALETTTQTANKAKASSLPAQVAPTRKRNIEEETLIDRVIMGVLHTPPDQVEGVVMDPKLAKVEDVKPSVTTGTVGGDVSGAQSEGARVNPNGPDAPPSKVAKVQ